MFPRFATHAEELCFVEALVSFVGLSTYGACVVSGSTSLRRVAITLAFDTAYGLALFLPWMEFCFPYNEAVVVNSFHMG